MNQDQSRRVIQAMTETQQMLAKLETAYERRPVHLRTDEDRKLISFHRNHIAKLTDILEGRPLTFGIVEDAPLVSAKRDISKFCA